MANITFDIVKEIGVIGGDKWNTELNLISWNGAEPKFDIRPWSLDHTKMGKGITLTKEELTALKALLNTIEEI